MDNIDTIDKVKASAANGLSISETEAIVGHQLSKDEKLAYNKVKAALKLKSRLPVPKHVPLTKVQPRNEIRSTPRISARYTKAQIEDIVCRTGGLTFAICKALDCTFVQWQHYLAKHKDIQDLMAATRDTLLDKAESVVNDNLESQDANLRQRAAEYILNHIGHKRGWTNNNIQAVQVSYDEQTKQIQAIFGIQSND